MTYRKRSTERFEVKELSGYHLADLANLCEMAQSADFKIEYEFDNEFTIVYKPRNEFVDPEKPICVFTSSGIFVEQFKTMEELNECFESC